MKHKGLLWLLVVILSFSVGFGANELLGNSGHTETEIGLTAEGDNAESLEVSDILNTTEPTEEEEEQDDKTKSPAKGTKGNLEVHYIDVGQGDSEFIRLPNGQTMLIDAGETATTYNYLSSLGVKKLDYVIFTHLHSDHIGGGSKVIDGFDIGSIYMPRKAHASQTAENLLLTIQGKGLKMKVAKAGVVILDEGDLKIELLGPVNDYSEVNNSSAITKITYKDTKFLFTGDAEEQALRDITADISADVYKVGHHGSETSTFGWMLDKMKPKHAVISCGAGNSYGHPDQAVLDLFKKYDVKVYATYELGTIIATSDGKNITLDKNAMTIQTNAPPVVTTQEEPKSSYEESNNASNNNYNQQERIVYRTKSGKKYHRAGCSYLKSCIEVTLSEALSRGLSPCSRCNP